MPAARNSGGCHPVKNADAQLGELSAATDPRRPNVRLRAIANDSSLPLNHLARAVVMATMRGSEPMPSTNRPAAIPG